MRRIVVAVFAIALLAPNAPSVDAQGNTLSFFITSAGSGKGGDTAGFTLFEEANVRDAALCALRDRITVEFVNGRPRMQSDVIVELTDGGRLHATHDAGIPSSDYVQQGERVRAKFERLAEPVLGPARTRALLQSIEALEKTSVADLMAACAAAREA